MRSTSSLSFSEKVARSSIKVCGRSIRMVYGEWPNEMKIELSKESEGIRLESVEGYKGSGWKTFFSLTDYSDWVRENNTAVELICAKLGIKSILIGRKRYEPEAIVVANTVVISPSPKPSNDDKALDLLIAGLNVVASIQNNRHRR